MSLWNKRLAGVLLVLGLLSVPPAQAQSKISEVMTTTVTLTTTQKELARRKYDKNSASWEQKSRTLTRFTTKNAIENIRQQTRSKFFKADAKFFSKINATASAETEFSSLVVDNYKETGNVTTVRETEEKQTVKMTLSPGDEVIIYENTTQSDDGGGYLHTWQTTEPLTEKEKKPIVVKFVVERDYYPILKEILSSVILDTAGITTDSEEWGAYSKICQEMLITRDPLSQYSLAVTQTTQTTTKLWTTGLDQASWSAVIAPAKQNKARQFGITAVRAHPEELQVLLLGFYNVRAPSHNAWAWDHLKAIATKYLVN